MKKILIPLLLVLTVILQYQLWMTPDGFMKTFLLKKNISAQQERNANIDKHNASIRADIALLKTSNVALEEHARADLGLIKQGEIFYQVTQ